MEGKDTDSEVLGIGQIQLADHLDLGSGRRDGNEAEADSQDALGKIYKI